MNLKISFFQYQILGSWMCTIWKWQFSKTLIYLDLSKNFSLFLISLLLWKNFSLQLQKQYLFLDLSKKFFTFSCFPCPMNKNFHLNFKNTSFSWHMKFFLTFWTLFSSFLLHYLSVRLEFFTSLLSLDLQKKFSLGLTVKTLNLPTNLAKYLSKTPKIGSWIFLSYSPGTRLIQSQILCRLIINY